MARVQYLFELAADYEAKISSLEQETLELRSNERKLLAQLEYTRQEVYTRPLETDKFRQMLDDSHDLQRLSQDTSAMALEDLQAEFLGLSGSRGT